MARPLLSRVVMTHAEMNDTNSISALVQMQIASNPGQSKTFGHVVVDSAGRIQCASPAGRAWVDQHGTGDALVALIREFDKGERWSPVARIADSELYVVRLNGDDGVRYLVISSKAPTASAPKPRLSPRQWEIAEFAAAGATIPEIARHFRRSPETVRSHIREIYRRLQVGSRVELARAMATPR